MASWTPLEAVARKTPGEHLQDGSAWRMPNAPGCLPGAIRCHLDLGPGRRAFFRGKRILLQGRRTDPSVFAPLARSQSDFVHSFFPFTADRFGKIQSVKIAGLFRCRHRRSPFLLISALTVARNVLASALPCPVSSKVLMPCRWYFARPPSYSRSNVHPFATLTR